MDWLVGIDPSVYKFLKKIPHRDTERIVAVLDGLSLDPFAGDIQKMKGGENEWRRRVGSYRFFYETHVREHFVYVFHVERRTSKTYSR